MIIFLNEERAYLSWVTHHRDGFVLDGKWKPKTGHLALHRATCGEIKHSDSRRTHWTTGGRFKGCSVNRAELEEWASEQTGAFPNQCAECQPQSDVLASSDTRVNLSKLPADILDYILDAALIHMEVDRPPYRLTAADIAACFGKSPGQISPALHRLIDGGYVIVQGHVSAAGTIPPKRVIRPTAVALRTLEAFQGESDSTIETELAKLQAA